MSLRFRGHPERQAPRLLPLDVHRRGEGTSGSSPRPSSRPPTPAAPSRAGTSPTSRPCSGSPWSCADDAARPSRTRAEVERRADGRRARARSASPTRWRCRPTSWRSSSAPSRRPSPIDVAGTPTRAAVPARASATSRAFGARGGRVLARATSPTTSTSPTPATRWTSSPSPTSPSAPWRTSGCVTFRETLLLADPDARHPGRAAERRRRDRPRARPHVVRRPGDDEVVERHLAQRGLRHLHGAEGHRRLPARSGSAGSASAWPASTAFDTDALASHPPDRVPGGARRTTPRACSTSSPTRRAPPSCGCSSSTSARTRFRGRHPQVHGRPPVRQHRDHRPVGRHRGGDRLSRCAASWTPGSSRAGYPIVSITASADGRVLHLTQEQFQYLPHPPSDAQWAVPLLLRVADETGAVTTRTALLEGDTLDLELDAPVRWVVGQRRGARVLPGPVRRAAARRPGRRGPGGPAPTSSGTASSTTPGPRSSPAPPRPPSSWPWPTASQARPTSPSGGACSVPSTRSTGLLDGAARTALQARVRALVGPGAGAARLGELRRRHRPRPGAARCPHRGAGGPRRRP